MGGSSKSDCKGCGQAGTYGTLGTADAQNIPGSRAFANSWTDGDGNFWLFGGGGYDSARNLGSLSDLWEFSPSTNEWTWIAGEETVTGLGKCNVLGTPDAGNSPGFREFSANWSGGGNLWLFGGWGLVVLGAAGSSSSSGDLNDLWKLDLSTGEWTCVIGSSASVSERGDRGIPGAYGRVGDFDDGYTPGGRENASGWTDKEGNLWLFGGWGRDSVNQFGALNDMWEFDPSAGNWAWIDGAEDVGSSGIYGEMGKSSPKNTPGGRQSAAAWTDRQGNFWLFGGDGVDAKGSRGPLNDLWKFNPSIQEWTWMGGSAVTGVGYVRSLSLNVQYPKGSYGTLGQPAPMNVPGGRSGASSWTDRDGNLWLFGGLGLDFAGKDGYLNDLWEYRFLSPTDAPSFGVAEGTYAKAQYVKIADLASDAAIYYTLDGSTPTTASTRYNSGITIAKTTTVKAIAVADEHTNSEVATAVYIITSAPAR
jgi:hypothetical protein